MLYRRRSCFTQPHLREFCPQGLLLLTLVLACLVLSSACLAQTPSDLISASNCKFQDGAVSVGLVGSGGFVPFDSFFTVCPGVSGWCMDKTPGIGGDVTLNTTEDPITFCGFVWQPGILYSSPAAGDRKVAVCFKPSKSQAVSCVANVAVKPRSGNAVTVTLSKNAVPVTSSAMNPQEKQETAVVSGVLEAGATDNLYFIIGNIENKLSGLVGVQLFVTADAAKFDPATVIKPAFPSAR